MNPVAKSPSHVDQLVWCPADPTLGVGLVETLDERRVGVHFLRLQERRQYTRRSREQVLVRYEIGAGEWVQDAEGKQVRIRRRCVAPAQDDIQDVWLYELENGQVLPEGQLRPNVRDVGPVERLASLALTHPETVRARVRGLKLAELGARAGVNGILGARAQLLPHQVDVAARLLEQDPIRMLLADEVGLGKTVEAALIFAGLRREGRAARVLVLAPEALCVQWLQELYRKTHELFVLMDGARIQDAERDFAGLNPFEAHQRMVVSLDTVAEDSILAGLVERAPWDLVVVDEAHHLRGGGPRGQNPAYRLVATLAARCRHLLLLTATPMALDPAEYHVLLRLLDSARFDDPNSFADVAHRAQALRGLAKQLAHALAAQTVPAPAEVQALQGWLADDPDDAAQLTALLAAQAAGDAPAAEALGAGVMTALRERHALADYVTRNRRGPVGGLPNRRAETFPLTMSEAQAALLDVGEEVLFELVQSIDDARARGRIAGELLRALWATPRALLDIVRPYSATLAAELAPHVQAVVQAGKNEAGLPAADARLAWLIAKVRGLAPGDKILVFVESGIAVQALKDALEPYLGGKVAAFHGQLSPRDQDRQVAYFRDPAGPQVMLSTEAGGEGRNFQFCNIVVLYDLPWRPATVEQRIGRIDRVGQRRDVHVWVPFYNAGFEAAVVKVMQQAIGVLDKTVGGMDHALEYVSDRLAQLILNAEGPEQWKALYLDTSQLVAEAQRRIQADVDPVLDHASFSPKRAQKLLDSWPLDVEHQLEAFLQRYAQHSKLQLHAKGAALVAVEGAPSAAGASAESGYVATFSRQHALDHEDVDFLSFGHPLVEQALEWAQHGHEASAALALCRGFAREGAAFLYTFGLDVPEDVPEVATYFAGKSWSLALDESGARVAELEALLAHGGRALDRMDPTPLRGSLVRWRALVEHNFAAAEAEAQAMVALLAQKAEGALEQAMRTRARHLKRAQVRASLAGARAAGSKGTRGQRKAAAAAAAAARPAPAQAQKTQDAAAWAAHAAEQDRLGRAIRAARPKLLTVLAVRLVKERQVSG